MSISTTLPRQRYAGDGTTTVFPVPFQFDLSLDLKVVLLDNTTEEETLLVKDTHYTVDGGAMETGSITLLSPPSSGQTLAIVNNPDPTQPEVLRENGPFPSTDVEQGLDRAVLIAQRAMDLSKRSLHFPDSEVSTVDGTLPSLESRKNMFAAYDNDGNPIASEGGIDPSLPISTIGLAVLQAATTADARTAIDAQQKTESLTVSTASPVAADDLLPLYKPSLSASRKIAVVDFMKVIHDFTVHSAPIPTDELLIYDSTGSAAKKLQLPGIRAGAKRAGDFSNVGLQSATGAVSGDTIKITGAAAALSSSNPLFINLPVAGSPGLTGVFKATADVSLLLTGAHGGRNTFGDFTDIVFSVYAINDNGTLKFGVCQKPNLRTIVDTNSSATPASVTTYSKMLVNSTLSSGTWPCAQIGWFLADFDDTGGSSEDLWIVQTAAGEICVGAPVPSPTGSVIVTTGNGMGVVSNKIRRFTTAEEVTSKAVKYIDNSNAGSSFTALEDGLYKMTYVDMQTDANFNIGISLNSSQLTTQIASITAADRKAFVANATGLHGCCSAVLGLSAGDVIRPHTNGGPQTTDLNCRFFMAKVRHNN